MEQVTGTAQNYPSPCSTEANVSVVVRLRDGWNAPRVPLPLWPLVPACRHLLPLTDFRRPVQTAAAQQGIDQSHEFPCCQDQCALMGMFR